MDALKTINTNLEACINLSVVSSSTSTVSFPQKEINDRLNTMLESAKQLELWFVEEMHKQRYPPNQNELSRLKAEIASMEARSNDKQAALERTLAQVGEWTSTMENLQARQISAMFDLVPPPHEAEKEVPSIEQPTNTSMSNDEMWWGQHSADEATDL